MDFQQLTKAQLTFYDFVWEFTRENRRKPTFKEIMEHFDYASTRSVGHYLETLVAKGYMTKTEDGEYLFTSKRPGLKANVEAKSEGG